MELALIAAAARNGVIGADNRLPWRLPEDLRYFKQITLGKPVIMGRKTYESIGRPLPGRTNIVLTRDPGWLGHPSLEVARDLASALAKAREALPGGEGEAMVMGGEQLYRAALPEADRVYLTRVDLDVAGDAHFPPLSQSRWREVACTEGDSAAAIAHRFLVYERRQ